MCRKLVLFLVAPVIFLASFSSFAAQPVDLRHQPVSILSPYLASPANMTALSGNGNSAAKGEQIEEINRSVDSNQTTHIRVQQTYSSVPVFGADAIIHVKNGNTRLSLPGIASSVATKNTTMNGTIFQNLGTDLLMKPEQVKGNVTVAIDKAITLSHDDFKTIAEPTRKTGKLIVYIDEAKKARYAFLIKLNYDAVLKAPTYILDAQSFVVYEKWNDAKTLSSVQGGGFGGNERMGRLVYDGLQGNLNKLTIDRDDGNRICYLRNSEVTVTDGRTHKVAQFKCDVASMQHGNVYWAGNIDQANGGYSPSNDALYAGSVVKEMYMKWYQVPMLVKNGKPMMLEMMSHAANLERPFNKNWENAMWYAENIYLGDGASNYYPLTSIGIVAHEISHGFTEQHSNLVYNKQSGGMNESFSDFAAQAAEQYAYGQSSWMIAAEISKSGEPMRYMETPSKDCRPGDSPYECSIDSANDYDNQMNVHGTSGVYNRMFYYLSHQKEKGWDVKKAFNVMLQANAHYWTSTSTFQEGACGVMEAAKDLKYDTTSVRAAFRLVDINVDKC